MSLVCLLSFVFTTQIEFCECCVWFQWFTQWCCTSFSHAVPCSKDMKRKEWFADGCLFVSSFFCLHNSYQVQWVLCLISMLRLMLLFPFLQSCCLFMTVFNSTEQQQRLVFLWPDKPNWALDRERCSSQVKHAQSCILPWQALQKQRYVFSVLDFLREHITNSPNQ